MAKEKNESVEVNDIKQVKKASFGKTAYVTQVWFRRENGIQLVSPNGSFLRYVQRGDPAKHDNNASSYHIVGIADVTDTGSKIVFTLKSGREEHVPYAEISKFTVENL